ncbi:U2 small nuclear ribonucleoprotein A' isoform X1 [Hydra vulgaris]|uniref:U2 small nuclear ribonucleoprotein A n=1 Tax=Hydra vulgaris TaxID=6087 RepID=T2MHP5_HYDVU|nr:U2 small nuclear ribonucleoprotein A' [Hydra vulgaris]
MVKLTADVIEQSPQYTNPLRDREIDLRGCKISVIENLGATLDQFDCIDMSDNDIKKVEGFPLLKRLRMLLLNNNRICRFEENLELVLPQLETLVLTNNNLAELADIDPLSTVSSLTSISLLRNPITNKPNYRSYIIYKLPQVRIIDFQRVRMKEREAAKKLFSGKKGEILKKEIAAKRSKIFEAKDVLATKEDEAFLAEKYKDQEAIKVAISNATTLEEVRKLELLLQQGYVPGKSIVIDSSEELGYGEINEVEMDE